MRGRLILCALGIVVPAVARSQVAPGKARQDSIGRGDSIARADSIALVKQLEKELGQQTADTAGNGTAQGPRAAGGYMNIGFVALTDAGWSTEPDVGAIQVGDHDPHVNGFSIPNVELT